jgi:hypothetical protein
VAALDTVAKFITQARVLLQDGTEPYRYSDEEMIQSLNLAVLEARRLRSDLFLALDFVPQVYTASGNATTDIDAQYRPAFLYFMVGYAQLRDEEQNQDQRAGALITKFATQLVGGAK